LSATIVKTAGNRVTIRITGLLKKSELDEVQKLLAHKLERHDEIFSLILLDRFEGWERGADWGDVTFAATHGRKIRKMALVGNPKWETEVLMFVGAGVRRTDIRYFPPQALSEAEAWLEES
jgi:hypothetical protein